MKSCCGQISRCKDTKTPSTSSLGPGRVSLLISLLARAIGTRWEALKDGEREPSGYLQRLGEEERKGRDRRKEDREG